MAGGIEMKIRRFVSFVLLFPTWPIVIFVAAIDNEAEVANVVSCFKQAWKRIYEK